jgi:hypothetical protein
VEDICARRAFLGALNREGAQRPQASPQIQGIKHWQSIKFGRRGGKLPRSELSLALSRFFARKLLLYIATTILPHNSRIKSIAFPKNQILAAALTDEEPHLRA